MDIKPTIFVAAALLACLGSAPAWAQAQGILACQITLSQFAEDVFASKARLRPNQISTAQQVVEVGRSQCRSTPDLVMTNIRTTRATMDLATGRRAGSHFSDFWPAPPGEVASLE